MSDNDHCVDLACGHPWLGLVHPKAIILYIIGWRRVDEAFTYWSHNQYAHEQSGGYGRNVSFLALKSDMVFN